MRRKTYTLAISNVAITKSPLPSFDPRLLERKISRAQSGGKACLSVEGVSSPLRDWYMVFSTYTRTTLLSILRPATYYNYMLDTSSWYCSAAYLFWMLGFSRETESITNSFSSLTDRLIGGSSARYAGNDDLRQLTDSCRCRRTSISYLGW